MKTFFEPKLNGIDESFSNMVLDGTGTQTVTAYVKPRTAFISPTSVTATVTSVPKTTTTISPTYATSTPKTTITTATTSFPKTTTSGTVTTPPSTTVTSTPIDTASSQGGYFGGGGGGALGGVSEEPSQGQTESVKKVGDVEDSKIFGIKKTYAYGIGLAALVYIYFKYIKK